MPKKAQIQTAKSLIAILLLGFLQLIQIPNSQAVATLNYSPSNAGTWTVPTGVTSITVTAYGGGGGSGAIDGLGNIARSPGARGYVVATFSVSAGQVIGIYPGRKGTSGTTSTNGGGGAGGTDSDPNGNYNGGTGGNAGASGSSGGGGGGGAASTIYLDATLEIGRAHV
mgnify:FL=1